MSARRVWRQRGRDRYELMEDERRVAVVHRVGGRWWAESEDEGETVASEHLDCIEAMSAASGRPS